MSDAARLEEMRPLAGTKEGTHVERGAKFPLPHNRLLLAWAIQIAAFLSALTGDTIPLSGY
jgi:hypothetical protein